jgi:hypothetical protein
MDCRQHNDGVGGLFHPHNHVWRSDGHLHYLLLRKQLHDKLFLMYNPNRLEWHLDDEQCCKPRRVLCGLVVRQASLLTLFNRLAVALAKSQDHRASCGVFAFGPDRQGALANGLHGLNPRNTGNRTHPLVCRPALIERLVKDWVQRWNKARSISESIPHGHLGFCGF